MARILVVDDEPDVRELFNITLKMAGHSTETAKDGVEAVERLHTDLPDLILLDLMMPRLDGFGLLNHIREHMGTQPVRVLIATAKVLEDTDHGRLGAWPVVGILNKGELDISAMVNVINTALSKEPLNPPAPEPAKNTPTASEPAPPAPGLLQPSSPQPAPAQIAQRPPQPAIPKTAPLLPPSTAETPSPAGPAKPEAPPSPAEKAEPAEAASPAQPGPARENSLLLKPPSTVAKPDGDVPKPKQE